MLALPGAAYVYQGEELGLPEVEDLPDEVLQDPIFLRSGGTDPGRDGCRVPLPWSRRRSRRSASARRARPRRPGCRSPTRGAPPARSSRNAPRLDALALPGRAADPRRRAGLGDGPLRWLDAPPDVLAFARDDTFANITNLGTASAPLPPHREVLVGGVNDDGTSLRTPRPGCGCPDARQHLADAAAWNLALGPGRHQAQRQPAAPPDRRAVAQVGGCDRPVLS